MSYDGLVPMAAATTLNFTFSEMSLFMKIAIVEIIS